MKNATEQQHRRERRASAATRVLTALAAALTMLGSGPARADVIGFDTMPASNYLSGTTLSEAGFNMKLIEGPVAASFGYVGATGVIEDSSSPFGCDIAACPSNAQGNYLAVINDGAVELRRGDFLAFSIVGLDFSFLPLLAGLPNFNYGRLQLSGTKLDGTSVNIALDFPGQDGNGNFMFGPATLDAAFRATAFGALTINACAFDGDLNCVNSLDNPAFNQAQFAIDNIDVRVLPEPSSYLLMGLGLGALALGARRRRPAAPGSITLPAQGI
jgi:hypothetical protein